MNEQSLNVMDIYCPIKGCDKHIEIKLNTGSTAEKFICPVHGEVNGAELRYE